MSLRTIAFLGLYGLAAAAAFVFPPAGVWGFLFESNNSPLYHWWGRPLAHIGTRWSYYIGAAMGLAVVVHWGRYQAVPLWKHWETKLLLLFTANACLVTLWAYDVDACWKEATDYLKWLLVYVCIVKTHSDRKWLPMILCIYILCCINAGWDATFAPPHGRDVEGGPTTAFGGNFLSAHAIALLPLVGLYALSPNVNRWFRAACLVGAPLMLNIVAHGQSRGAFLALIAAGIAMLLLTQGRLRKLTILALLLGCLAGARLFHEQFWNRMSTIETYEEEGSAMSRIDAWKDAWRLAQKNSFGYGAEAFDLGLKTQSKSTHNMFFEVLVAWGWQGTIFLFGLILVTMWSCWQLRRKLYQPGQWPQPREYLETVGILAGIISMLVAAIFLNRARWELWWIFPAYVVCLKNICAVSVEPDADDVQDDEAILGDSFTTYPDTPYYSGV